MIRSILKEFWAKLPVCFVIIQTLRRKGFCEITLGYSYYSPDPLPSKSQLSFILVKTNQIQVQKLVLSKTKLKQKLAVTEAIYFESKVM